MLFTLEALQAEEGDCLLLHWGEPGDRRLLLVDGGPAGVYKRSLRPRLEALKAELSPDEPLLIDLTMVSHIDGDHVVGIVELTDELIEADQEQQQRPFVLGALWHNSFEDILGEGALVGAPASVATLAAGGPPPADLPVDKPAELIVASVKQGQQLRDNAKALQLEGNKPFGGLVTEGRTHTLDGLKLTVVAPAQPRLDKLKKKWDAEVRKQQAAEVAAYLDRSVFNLSSIVVLAELGGKTILLTGDARGDDTLAGLGSLGLMPGGTIEVDILKLPHHGSDRNVELDYFEKIRARNYVVSANGEYKNPDIATFKLLMEARADDDFCLHFTNRDMRNDIGTLLAEFIQGERDRGRDFGVKFREDGPLRIDLLDPLAS